ncbi:hypothetical protein BKA61DRAFT_667565 [Leptodontidium sp. MPI-SDFR-AT-0119]|nr:hypothetical protein BKA61DRAFT_667565 [Leptodontidium sp. MPI-SDFR-AT-0119]
MAIVKDINLKAEHEKATTTLKLIKDALLKEQAVKDEEEALSEAHRDIGGLKAKGSESGDDHDLEERTRLMQENLNLLIQRKEIKNLSSKIKDKQADLNQTVRPLSAAESMVLELELNVHGLALALEKLHFELQNPELSSAQDTIKSHLTRITSLGKTIEIQDSKIEQLNYEVEHQKSINRQEQKLASLLLTAPLLQSPQEDTTKTVAENMQAAYEESRKFQCREMAGLYEAGCAIRARKFVWLSATNDDLVSGLGNKASHYGMALADAALYQPTCPAPYRRVKLIDFTKLYVVRPEFVWKHQSALKLLEILDWHGGMQDFSSASSVEVIFRPLFARLITSINDAKFTTGEVVKLLETPNAIKDIAELKVLHDAGLQKHNAWLMNW